MHKPYNLRDTAHQVRHGHRQLRFMGRGVAIRKPKKQQHPKAIALRYYQSLRSIMAAAKRLVDASILPLLGQWEREAGTWRGDAVGNEATKLFDDMVKRFDREFPNKELEHTAERIARSTSEFQKEQIVKQTRAALSVDVFKSEPWLDSKIATFTAENVSLIKSLPERYFREIQGVVIRGVSDGKRPAEIASDFQDRFDIADDRALLIANDQVGSFFADLNRTRQQELGVEKYTWKTAEDERVRESHAELDGETFSWDDPPEVDGENVNPGDPINCRCQGIPDFSDVVEAFSE